MINMLVLQVTGCNTTMNYAELEMLLSNTKKKYIMYILIT